MELINILILWLTLGLILISFNQTKKHTGEKKTKVRKSIFTIKTKNNSKETDEPQKTEQHAENITSSEPTTQTSSPTTPEPKKADIFIADFEQGKDDKNTVDEKKQKETSVEPIVEPIEEEVENIENAEGEPEFDEGIMTAAEVEEDESFFSNLEIENVFDKFFSEENMSQPSTFTVEESEDEDEVEGEYNTFSTSEEPWYEHESVRKLVGNNNIFKKEPKEFEIIEKNY